MNQLHEDEINLFDLFQTLWDGKWKIIATTFVAASIGFVFSYIKPNYFEVTTPIQMGKQSIFLPYTSLNSLLKKENLLFDKIKNPSGFRFDNESIFKQFVIEFNDYNEMVNVLSNDDFVKQSIKDLDESDKKRKLIYFAKLFEIKLPQKKENKSALTFLWHEPLEGVKLFNDAIQQTLINVQKATKNNVNELALAIDRRNSNELEILRSELKNFNKMTIELNKKRIQFLTEHSAIARDLGIERNTLNSNLLFQSDIGNISLNILNADEEETAIHQSPKTNVDDVPYYLRGYKAIDKEISLIRSRSDEDNLLRLDGYFKVKAKIISLENDLVSSQLRTASALIETDSVNDWIEFDLVLFDSVSQNKPYFYIAIYVFFGGIIGLAYVFISNAIRERKEQLAKA